MYKTLAARGDVEATEDVGNECKGSTAKRRMKVRDDLS